MCHAAHCFVPDGLLCARHFGAEEWAKEAHRYEKIGSEEGKHRNLQKWLLQEEQLLDIE
jgi:hypothetical protein